MKRLNDYLVENNKRIRLSEHISELGIIESVCLKNFMCHDHLKFDFDPHVNFIIGQNGSGKSAILTGIILALGGKSSSTGRYANVKGFIKTGKNKAYLSVTLRNKGDYAYRPDQYGEKIVVEREINIEGISVYKLKSGAGRIISNHKEELNNILDAMDIQVENPVLVLTQETSRNFLVSKQGSEQKLYEFYYKGTGLQALEDNYRQATLLKDEALNDLNVKQKALPEMKKELSRWKNIVDSSKKVNDLKKELFWANIKVMEERVEEVKQNLQKLKTETETYHAEAEKCKAAYDAQCVELDENQKQRSECDARMNDLKNIVKTITQEKERSAEEVRKSQGMVELYKRQEQKLKEDIAALEGSILETQMKNQSYFDEDKKKRLDEIFILESENKASMEKHSELKEESDHILKQKHATDNEIQTLQTEINSYEYKMNNIGNRIKQLRQAIVNRQLLFGDRTPEILSEIKMRQREFSKPPRGPIGLGIEVIDPRWYNAVETCIKPAMLRSYCCDNALDSRLLTSILKKYYGQNMPSVIVSSFLPHVHDVSRHKTQTIFPTVLDMLRIPDPVIANCLIDQLSIENKILIEEITTAQNLMLDNPPKNCYSAFLMNCDEILLNPYRHYSASKKITNSILQSVDQSHIRSLEIDYQQLNEEVQNRKRRISELRSELQKYPSKLKEIERNIVRLVTRINQNSNRINELGQFEEPKDVSEMEEDLLSLRHELDDKSQQVRESDLILRKNKEEFKEKNASFMEFKERFFKEKALFDDLGDKITKCSRKKEVIATAKRKYESDKKDSEKRLKQIEQEYKNHQEKTDAAIAKAKEAGNRVITTRSPEEIKNQIEETEKVIQESSNCDRTELFDKFKQKFEKYQQAVKDLQRIENIAKMLDKMMRLRERKLDEIIKVTQGCLQMAFSVVLKGNDFSGRLDFSKPGCLRLEATPRQADPAVGGKKQCSSLSGGERSFVTIAFLFALWDRIKMPFRILDEYDVFMDSNNRNLSINLLIKRADFMRNVQFIFLSPLELPEMKESDYIKIHKMPAPERHGVCN